ncbi:aspartic acid-rich protein-like [Ylistrum balloti]|uniref:aspartic acid-rich protein-like n=1 Tax=Ylistrum balloti TaxID=509963 RepID=UPI002905A1BB|nr:aspartic acid-rich protein-like [Ylistrum balloti]
MRMKENFLHYNEERNSLRRELIVKRDELDRVQQNTLKLEKEVGAVTSQRDYEQIDRAIRESHEQNNLEELQHDLSDSEDLLQAQEKDLEKIKDDVQKEMIKHDVQLKELQSKETEITVSMDRDLVFKFERILKSRSGDGIVPIRKNVCYGCHMLLPLKIVNEVCEERKVITCPYCSKILFYDGDSDDEEVDNIEIAGLRDIIDAEDIILDDFDEEDYHAFIQKDDLGSDEYVQAKQIEELHDEDDDDDDGDDIEDKLADLEDSEDLDEDDNKIFDNE